MNKKSGGEILDSLFAVIESRRGGNPKLSYTASLLNEGTGTIARKVGEEAVETIIAALQEGPDALAVESADLLYHLCVLWADAGLKPDDIWARLAERKGVSGLIEKANRKN